MTTNGKNRIMIYGPKTDGTYVVEFSGDFNTEDRDRDEGSATRTRYL